MKNGVQLRGGLGLRALARGHDALEAREVVPGRALDLLLRLLALLRDEVLT